MAQVSNYKTAQISTDEFESLMSNCRVFRMTRQNLLQFFVRITFEKRCDDI